MLRIALIALTVPAAHGASAATAVPRIVCDQPVFAFGERDNSQTVVHRFTLRNDGTAPLVIERVRSSCGCTVAALQRKHIAAGETTTLTAQFLLNGRQGPQKKSLDVISNDPLHPTFSLWLQGTAVAGVAAEPAYVNFGTLVPDARKTLTVNVVGRRKELVIEQVTCPSEAVRAAPWRDASGAVGVSVATQPPLRAGALRASVRVLTRDGEGTRRELVVPVYGIVKDRIVVIPEVILLPRGSTERTLRTLLLRPGSVADFVVEGVTVPDESIQVDIKRQGRGTYCIELRNVPAGEHLHNTSVRILTTADGMRVIDVPIRRAP